MNRDPMLQHHIEGSNTSALTNFSFGQSHVCILNCWVLNAFMVIQNTFGALRLSQVLADRQRMKVDSRQVNASQEILFAPQMFNQGHSRQIQSRLRCSTDILDFSFQTLALWDSL